MIASFLKCSCPAVTMQAQAEKLPEIPLGAQLTWCLPYISHALFGMALILQGFSCHAHHIFLVATPVLHGICSRQSTLFMCPTVNTRPRTPTPLGCLKYPRLFPPISGWVTANPPPKSWCSRLDQGQSGNPWGWQNFYPFRSLLILWPLDAGWSGGGGDAWSGCGAQHSPASDENSNDGSSSATVQTSVR